MGFLITEAQRKEVAGSGIESIPARLSQILLANHARVLDWFRSIDTNFDGCISKNEMAFALHALGMNASPKEVQQLFDALDPDGNGVVEFEELQTALRQGLQLQSAPKKRPLSRAQRERLKLENMAASYELKEMIYDFERQRGLEDPGARRPPSAAAMLKKEQDARVLEMARKAREDKEKSIPVERGEWFSRIDSCWVKSPLLRPATAPNRLATERAAAKRKEAVYNYWLEKHRDEIEAHQIMVAKEYADDKRIRKERVQNRRDGLLESMRQKREASKLGALDRHEPFPTRKEMQSQRSSLYSRQRDRAWSQDIVFLPPTVAARESSLVRERRMADYKEGIYQVRGLQ